MFEYIIVGREIMFTKSIAESKQTNSVTGAGVLGLHF